MDQMSLGRRSFGIATAAMLYICGIPAHGLVGIESSIRSPLISRSQALVFQFPSTGPNIQGHLRLTDPITKSLNRSIADSVLSAMRKRGMLPVGFKLVSDAPDGVAGFELSDAARTAQTLKYSLNGIESCAGDLRVARLRDGSIQIMTSNSPAGEMNLPDSMEFPALDDIEPILSTYASQSDQQLGGSLALGKCWHIDNQVVAAALTVRVHLDNLPYKVIATADRMVRIEPLFFSAVGKSRIFKNNPTDSALASFSLGELTGTGKLESSAFTTQTNDATPAQSCDHNFSYDEGDERFAEASAFTNTTRTLSWFKSQLGYEWQDEPMTIRIHEEIGSPPNEKNNALYQPSSATEDGKANILIGDGDGIQLQNLALDQDVVSHEFGHHIVYRTLKSTVRESLVLHEGLADFFTFARTDNACLGESICPDGSQICWSATCLRTAENSLKFTDTNLPTQAHLRSQFISGLLWDLKITKEIPIEDVAKIVFKAVDFFASEMVYEQFIAALISADQELFDGKNCAAILESATERGLAARITKLKCNNAGLRATSEDITPVMALTESASSGVDEKYILKISENLEDAIATTSLCSSPAKSKGALLTPCGVVGHDGSGPKTAGLIFLSPLFAIIIVGFARRKRSSGAFES
jgi:hypothetical protein